MKLAAYAPCTRARFHPLFPHLCANPLGACFQGTLLLLYFFPPGGVRWFMWLSLSLFLVVTPKPSTGSRGGGDHGGDARRHRHGRVWEALPQAVARPPLFYIVISIDLSLYIYIDR